MTKLMNASPCPYCGQTLFIMNNPVWNRIMQRPKQLTRYVHRRGMRGDVETHAESKEHAIAIFRHYGFPDASESNVSPGRSKVPVIPASDDFERAK